MKQTIASAISCITMLTACSEEVPNLCFPLSKKLEFKHNLISEICTHDIETLWNSPMYGYKLDPFDEGIKLNRKYYHNCADGKPENKLQSTKEAKVIGTYMQKCELLTALKSAQIPTQSFLEKIKVTQHNNLPPTILAVQNKADETLLKTLGKQKKTAKDLISKRKIRTTMDTAMEYNDLQTHITEIIRADFNHDGIEDIWTYTVHIDHKQSKHIHKNIILTRKKKTGPLQIVPPQDLHHVKAN